MSLLFWGRLKNSPSVVFFTPNLKSGCTRLLTSGTLFLYAIFIFFIFSTRLFFLLRFCSYNLRLRCLSNSIQQFSSFFFGCERGPIYGFSFLMYTVVEVGGMGDLFFLKSSSLRMGSEETNIGSSNLKVRRLLNECCTCIPTYLVFHSIIKLHYVFNLRQIVFWMCVNAHTFF